MKGFKRISQLEQKVEKSSEYNTLFNKDIIAQYPGYDYSNEVLELYILENLAPISFWVLDNGRCILWYEGNGISMGCQTSAVLNNNQIYPLVVYYGATQQYPNGTIMGYVIMKDIESAKQHSQDRFVPNINFEFANQKKNSLLITSYLDELLYNNAVTEPKIANNAVTQSKIQNSSFLFPFVIPFNPDYSNDIKEFLLLDIVKNATDFKFYFNHAYNGRGYLFFTYGNREYGARTTKEVANISNGEIIPISIYHNADSTFANDTIVAYVIFSDITSFISKETSLQIPNINKDYCLSIENNSIISMYLGLIPIQIQNDSVTQEKIANGSELFPIKYPVTNYPDYYNDIKELYIPIDLSEAIDLSIWSGSNNIFMWFTLGGNLYGARGPIPAQNNKIYEFKIYYGATETLPNGTLVGYIIFKNYLHFIQNTTGSTYSGGNVNYKFCSNIKNSPQIAKELQYYINSTPAPTEFIPNLRLPNKIYAIVGDTLQLFYRAILDTWTITNYKIRIVCNVGKAYPRYFEYLPTDDNIGETSLQVQILNQIGELITSASTTIKTVSKGNSPSTNKNIFIFGDSLTVGGQWPVEMRRRLVTSGGSPSGDSKNNITFCGSMISGQTNYFGVGGWSWTDYITRGRAGFRFYVSGVNQLSVGAVYSNNGHNYTITEINVTEGIGNVRCDAANYSQTPQASGILTKVSGTGDSTITFNSYIEDSQNPLWDDDNNKFTFIPYANTYGNGQIDVVYTLLTWNSLPSESIPLTDEATFNIIKGYVKTFADKLHEEFPNAKLKLIGLQVPSLDGGYTANYGTPAANWVVDFHGLKNAFFYNKMLQTFANSEGYSDFVEFVDAGFQFDSEYGEQYTMKAVNTRMPNVTEKIGTNGVHPSTAGYMMFADAAYRNFIANFCQ